MDPNADKKGATSVWSWPVWNKNRLQKVIESYFRCSFQAVKKNTDYSLWSGLYFFALLRSAMISSCFLIGMSHVLSLLYEQLNSGSFLKPLSTAPSGGILYWTLPAVWIGMPCSQQPQSSDDQFCFHPIVSTVSPPTLHILHSSCAAVLFQLCYIFMFLDALVCSYCSWRRTAGVHFVLCTTSWVKKKHDNNKCA